METFHWITVRAYCHATEDEEKVLAALRTVMPEGEVAREVLEGHHGNPIVALTIREERADRVRAVWRRIADALGKDELLRDLAVKLDDDVVYHLRLDKQKAFAGTIERAATDDTIALRAKVAAYPKKRENAERVLREALEAA